MTQHDQVLGGRYQLDEVIGRGGMAEVWRARDIRLGRDVAVKRLRVDLATDPTFQARFRREAQSAAGLNHPNIVATYDTGEDPDDKTGIAVPYIVMELVEGHTLRDVLRSDRRIRPEKALEWTQGVLDALQHSHRAGIIHRDIKPANVMLTPNGHVTVMDFGIARAVADTSATMTQTAAVIGTAQYLSPEQARGETVDSRSDIYSAGCLLYELLTGRPPFVGDSPVSVAYQHVREAPVPPSQLDPELTSQMDAIALKSLAKDPAQRYQSAKEMRDDIARLLAGQEVTAVIPTPVAPVAAPTAVTQVVSSPATASSAASATETLVPSYETAEQETDEQPKKSRVGWIIAGLLGLLLLVGGIFGYQLLGGGKQDNTAMVPTVIGQTEQGAISQVETAGFTAKVTKVNGPADTEGQVTDQDPDAGVTLEKGKTVTIELNEGPATNKIPAGLVGMSEAEARKALTEANFPAGNITVKDASVEQESEHLDFTAGQIVASNPASGAEVVPATQKVTLFRATGKSPVPSLEGMTHARAEKEAKQSGFALSPSAGDSDAVVVGQNPKAGSMLTRGETITVQVEQEDPEVPSVVGRGEDEAKQLLEKAGFGVKVTTSAVTDQSQDGTVVDQDPKGGTATKGSTVTISVGTYRAAPAPADPTSSQPQSTAPSTAASSRPPASSAPPATSTASSTP
ncbi:Stk1 family PASTA domain-containing Ser/Thr kinase [Luteococcus peritonei]|uniref:non-specific serine/threonine protein kinase n=1 Tax=Luteococcus peritonei TaxID=88874 RepID=A0ABW4RY45_9ACTN